jgi:hypothetical protein
MCRTDFDSGTPMKAAVDLSVRSGKGWTIVETGQMLVVNIGTGPAKALVIARRAARSAVRGR